MSWHEEYKRKLVSAEEAVKIVKSGDRVSFTYGREPRALGLALAARASELKDVRIFIRNPSVDFGWYDPGWEESFKIDIGYVLPIVRDMVAEKRCDFVVGGLFGITPQHPVVHMADVVFTEVSPPDEHGFCSFGASVWGKKEAIRQAKVAIAEVNGNLIRTYGDNFIGISEIDYFVEHTPSNELPGAKDLLGRKNWDAGDVEKSIAGYVSSLVQDGSTLQVGVGSTSEWIVQLGALDNKGNLGWHSETTPRGVIRLIREGVINGRLKKVNRDRAVAIAVGGGAKEDMDWVNGNPMVELYDADYVLDPRVIGANDQVVAVNSAIAVDLTGQIAAESLGPQVVSGPGGQLAFSIGAQLSRGGQFISVLPSTARDGTVSRIVPLFDRGTVVTVPRTLTDVVVTEYGVARLRGKSQRERALELISIAQPDFRTELKTEAERLFWP